MLTQPRAAGTSGASTTPQAKAASRRAAGRTLPVQQVEQDGTAGRAVHRGIGQGRPELGVGQHELLNRFKVGGQAPERGRPGRLGHGGRVPLKRWVHCLAPVPAAAAPPAVSARSAATASSMRSWWASAFTSRPITRSTTSITISPMRAAASSTAR